MTEVVESLLQNLQISQPRSPLDGYWRKEEDKHVHNVFTHAGLLLSCNYNNSCEDHRRDLERTWFKQEVQTQTWSELDADSRFMLRQVGVSHLKGLWVDSCCVPYEVQERKKRHFDMMVKMRHTDWQDLPLSGKGFDYCLEFCPRDQTEIWIAFTDEEQEEMLRLDPCRNASCRCITCYLRGIYFG